MANPPSLAQMLRGMGEAAQDVPVHAPDAPPGYVYAPEDIMARRLAPTLQQEPADGRLPTWAERVRAWLQAR